ncbi:hypothetical protein QTH97_33550 [Variovorax sp. J22R24]|nr:hypothetical protein [Variovorax sp. J22R24]MDM0109879.1 hypothetical protein [Variovorax sp. J22R24]
MHLQDAWPDYRSERGTRRELAWVKKQALDVLKLFVLEASGWL